MSVAAFLISNASAMVASIGAAITLGTFIYKDIVERRRRKRLAISTLAYQIHLLRSEIESGSHGTALMQPAVLHPFADVFLENDTLLTALTAFGAIHGQWERSRENPDSFAPADRTKALDLLTTRGSDVYSFIRLSSGPIVGGPAVLPQSMKRS